jgi:cytochrome P450
VTERSAVRARAGRCPVVHGVPFDPIKLEQVLNPHPWMAIARREAPVFFMPEYDAWCVTRYDDVLAVLKDTESFSSKRVVEPRHLPGLAESRPDGHPMAAGLVNTEPPEHTHLRKLAQKAFTPKMVASYEPATRQMAHDIIDTFIDDGHADLIQVFSRDLTGQAITAVIGAPPDKAKDFEAWSDNNLTSLVDSPPLSDEREKEMIKEVVTFNAWLLEFIEDRRANPREDYASLLVHAESDDGSPALTTFEVVRILTNVISAGLDTTSSLIGLSLYNLLRPHERWERLLEDPTLVPTAVEETLRYDDPIHGIRRDVLADSEIGGVPIPARSVLYLSYASAQRDETVFERPDEFDLDRDDVDKHFAFGRWKHFCLGAPLARMETKVALEVLLERIPSLRLAPGAELEVLESRMGAFLTGLRFDWDA